MLILIEDLFMNYKKLGLAKMYTDLSYLLLVAATFGAVLVLGIVVASVVFNTENLIEPALSHYYEGIIMSEIFRRFSYFAYFMAFVIFLYEGYKFKMMQRDNIAGVSAVVSIFTLLMFSAVYVPKILALQAEGEVATQSDAFAALHSASEIDFKILALALLVLFFRRVMLLRTLKS